jgi:hypothetical protein
MFLVTVVVVMSEVDADVEMFVIPVRLMIATPLPRRVHAVHVGVHLAAVFAVARDIAVNARTIRFQAAVTIVFPIAIRTGRTSERQYQPAGQSARQQNPTP